ncbi:Sec-independent protein translocase subunit TatA [Streptomyces sp. NPDC127044]
MFSRLGAPEILLILVVVILVFGAKRLPDMARSLGQSMRILKTETRAMRAREDETTADPPPARTDSADDVSPENAALGRHQTSTPIPFRDTVEPR